VAASKPPPPADVVATRDVDAGVPADAPVLVVAAPADASPAPRPAAAKATSNPEAQLVERARVALRRGATDEALRTLMSHERRFPAGQLAEERDVLVVEAYLAAGNLSLARERLDHYRSSYRDGLHEQRAAAAERELERRR
jgi:outer membrane protein assembly factor BamD (BamD/ComL family)